MYVCACLYVYLSASLPFFCLCLPAFLPVCLSLCLLWLVECCFTSTETVGLLGTGAQDGHFDFHTAPELCLCLPVCLSGVYLPACMSICLPYCLFSLCLCLPVCLSAVCLCVPGYMSVCLFAFLSFYFCLPISLPACLLVYVCLPAFLSMSVYLFVYVCLPAFLSMSVCLFGYVCLCLSACLFVYVCLPVGLSVCLSDDPTRLTGR